MKAGDLDRRVTIQRATVTQDEFGGEVDAWAPLKTVWAQVLPVIYKDRGERYSDAQVVATKTTRFRIRWFSGLTVMDRMVFDGRVFEIIDVNEIGRREGLELTTVARAD